MARQLRIDFPAAVHHVTSRGNEGHAIVRDDDDREAFLRFLGKAVKRFRWSLLHYVLMTNHFHLVVRTPEPNLSRGMHWLNGSYAAWFNRRHHRWGHLFGGRFKSILVDEENYLLEVIRYVALNPVRAKMVSRPEDYRWSAHRAIAGITAAPDWLDVEGALMRFAPSREAAAAAYGDFIALKVGGECLWNQLTHGIYLGGKEWAKGIRKILESNPVSSDHPITQRAIGRPEMYEVIAAVAASADRTPDEIRKTRGGALRRLAAWLGWHEGLHTLASIAASLRLRSEGHVSGMIRRVEEEFGSDAILLNCFDVARATLRA